MRTRTRQSTLIKRATLFSEDVLDKILRFTIAPYGSSSNMEALSSAWRNQRRALMLTCRAWHDTASHVYERHCATLAVKEIVRRPGGVVRQPSKYVSSGFVTHRHDELAWCAALAASGSSAYLADFAGLLQMNSFMKWELTGQVEYENACSVTALTCDGVHLYAAYEAYAPVFAGPSRRAPWGPPAVCVFQLTDLAGVSASTGFEFCILPPDFDWEGFAEEIPEDDHSCKSAIAALCMPCNTSDCDCVM